MNNKTGKIIGWVLTALVTIVFAGSGLAKLAGGEASAEIALGVGGTTNVMILGILELLIVAVFLVPKTAFIGALLMIAYMGGAIAVHFVNHQPLATVIIIQVLIWATGFFRFPEWRNRLVGNKTTE